MKVLKKIGSILLCLLPFLLAFVIQIIVSVGGLMIKLIITSLQDPSVLQMDHLYNSLLGMMGDSNFIAALSALYAIIAALVMGFWYWKRFVPKKQPRREISSILNPAMVIGLIFLVIGTQYISGYITLIVSAIHPAWYDTYESLMNGIGFDNVSLILALYSVLIAPISEELIFRGVTLKYAKKAMPFMAANIFQAFLFGLFHANMIQGAYAFVVGMFCGYVCLKGGSIYLSILFHMLFNLWGTFSPEFLSYSGDSILIHLAIAAGAALFALFGIFLYGRGVENREPMPEAYLRDE
ncbi:MAG: CPBP family intramembrane metalloprotease [Lachnospiraceae bacterium]|nr:CPBP family intramembrane metalloprotease [Lachnospiraceae bacterium]